MDDSQIEAECDALTDELIALIQGKSALAAIIALSYMGALTAISQGIAYPDSAVAYADAWLTASEQGREDGAEAGQLVVSLQNAPSSSLVN
jgi:hypothetical protein